PPQPPIPEPTPEPTPVPPTPTPIPPPSPSPTPLPPFIPIVPTPPPAGQAAVAGIRVGRAVCITHASQVQLEGTHITDVLLRVDGRVVRRETLRILQRSTTPLTRLFGPGRHVLTIRLSFEKGSATPP